MREVVNRTAVELEIRNPSTGELFQIEGTNTETSKYYSIRNITSRINAMDLFSILEKVCKSSKDIKVINILLDKLGSDNRVRIDNISNLANELEVSRSKLNAILKQAEDNNFFKKLDRGIYFVNPYVFVGRRVRTNELRANAQEQWNELAL